MAQPMLFVARAANCFNGKGELCDAGIAESLAQVPVALDS